MGQQTPNSDELAMILAILGRLSTVGLLSAETLKLVTDELHHVAMKGEPPEGGLTKRFVVEFKDGTLFEHNADGKTVKP